MPKAGLRRSLGDIEAIAGVHHATVWHSLRVKLKLPHIAYILANNCQK